MSHNINTSNMFQLVVLLLFVVYESSANPCGGSEGDGFNHFDLHNTYGNISNIIVWAGAVVDGIQVSETQQGTVCGL